MLFLGGSQASTGVLWGRLPGVVYKPRVVVSLATGDHTLSLEMWVYRILGPYFLITPFGAQET
jgi:hypothetical protein